MTNCEDVPGGIQTALLEEAEREKNLTEQLISGMEGGLKEAKAWHFDEGKPTFELIPQWGLLQLARVAEYGKRKYGKHNYADFADSWDWLDVVGSILRHVFAFLRGEWLDTESQIAHLAHAAFNCLMLCDLYEHRKGNDDRSPFAVGWPMQVPPIEDMVCNPPLITDVHDPRIIEAQTEINRRLSDDLDKDAFASRQAERDSNIAWKKKVDDLNREAAAYIPLGLEGESIPDEELHDDELTFEPLSPETKAYWAKKLNDAVNEIIAEGK